MDIPVASVYPASQSKPVPQLWVKWTVLCTCLSQLYSFLHCHYEIPQGSNLVKRGWLCLMVLKVLGLEPSCAGVLAGKVLRQPGHLMAADKKSVGLRVHVPFSVLTKSPGFNPEGPNRPTSRHHDWNKFLAVICLCPITVPGFQPPACCSGFPLVRTLGGCRLWHKRTNPCPLCGRYKLNSRLLDSNPSYCIHLRNKLAEKLALILTFSAKQSIIILRKLESRYQWSGVLEIQERMLVLLFRGHCSPQLVTCPPPTQPAM